MQILSNTPSGFLRQKQIKFVSTSLSVGRVLIRRCRRKSCCFDKLQSVVIFLPLILTLLTVTQHQCDRVIFLSDLGKLKQDLCATVLNISELFYSRDSEA